MKPSWIARLPSDEHFMGLGESVSLEAARKVAQQDALIQIRLRFGGGNISSQTLLKQNESRYGSSEIYQSISKVSVDGFVTGQEVDHYMENTYLDGQLAYRYFTLFHFNQQEYTAWYMSQIGEIELALDAIQRKQDDFGLYPGSEQISEVLFYLNEVSHSFKVLKEKGVGPELLPQLNTVKHRIAEQASPLLSKIRFGQKKYHGNINPFDQGNSVLSLKVSNNRGKPAPHIPIILTSLDQDTLINTLTDDDGNILIPLSGNEIPGSSINYIVVAGLDGIKVFGREQAELRLTFRYSLFSNVLIQHADIHESNLDLNRALRQSINSTAIEIITDRDDASGALSGTITLDPSSNRAGLYFVNSIIDIKFQPSTHRNEVYDIAFEQRSEGRSYPNAAQNGLNMIAHSLYIEITKLLNN